MTNPLYLYHLLYDYNKNKDMYNKRLCDSIS